MGIINFDFGDVKSAVESKLDKLKDDAREVLADHFGDQFVKQGVFGEGSMLKETREAGQDMFRKVGNTAKFNKLTSIYKDLWKERYQQLQDMHRASVNVDRPSPHQTYKSENMGEPAYHNNESISYSTVTLWTGYFRDVITDAFEGGGNDILQITNLLMTSGFQLQLDNMPRGAGGKNFYEEVFTPWFRDKMPSGQIGSEGQYIVQVDAGRALELMIDMFENGPMEKLIHLFQNLDLEI